MIDVPPLRPFHPHAPDAAGIVSWAHLGDLHMTLAGQQNHLDLLRIIAELNRSFLGSLSFVFLPGDVAEHGSADEYTVVRKALETLNLPWCAIVGDHDVHEKSFANFLHFMAAETHYSFVVGNVTFFGLNAFDVPDPGSFLLLSNQLVWLEEGLNRLSAKQTAILLLHCYPTDLKQGAGELQELISRDAVCLVEMGHTHYNEVANDGKTLYAATRSTGQIEEGPVGFSVTNIDGPVVSWKFLPLGSLPAVIITSPADERFLTEQSAPALAVKGSVSVRAKVWGAARRVTARLATHEKPLELIAGSQVWQGTFPAAELPGGIYPLVVEVAGEHGEQARDEIRVLLGDSAYQAPDRAARDQENALQPWPERGLLGTQLGPNKNGKKW